MVDSWTAYEWLSDEKNQTIGKVVQNTKIDETVDSLLKLALLIEHGGILTGHIDNIVVANGFGWLDGMFAD